MKKVAVIGLGSIATRHRKNLKYMFPNAEILGMSASGRIPTEEISDCDLIVANLDELIKANVEMVIVASPAPFHTLHALPLIEAGIPTLIEKPVTASVASALKIQKAVEKHGTSVAIGYCLRYLPSAQKLKALFSEDKIGKIYNANIEIGQYLPDWRPQKDYRDCVSAQKKLGGGALLELSHEFDYAQWLLGPLTLQHAILRSSEELSLDVEDMVDVVAITNTDAIVNIHLDFLQHKATRKCSFIGSKGRLDWDLISNQLIFTDKTQTVTLYSEPEWDKNQMYIEMIIDFISMIDNKNNNSVKLSEAVNTISFIEEIKQKAC